MSYKVVREVLEHARAEGADRLVLLAIADVAYHDGIGWLPQGPEDEKKSIAAYARCSERQVRRSVDDLQGAGELEVRRVQQGRKRKLIYRIVVGQLRELEIDYERLNFTLPELFSTPAELALRGPRRPARLSGGEGDDDGSPLPIGDSASEGSDSRTDRPVVEADHDRPSDAGRPDIYDRDDRTQASGRIENGPEERSREQSDSTPLTPLKGGTGESLHDRATARFSRRLPRKLQGRFGDLTADTQARIISHYRTATGIRFVRGQISGSYRSDPLGTDVPPASVGHQRPSAIEFFEAWLRQETDSPKRNSLRNLVTSGLAEEARYLIDVEWATLSQVERSGLHEFVDELLSERLPEASALEEARGAA